MTWPREIAAHVEGLVHAEAAALEALCEAAWALTDPDRRDHLQIVTWSGLNPPPMTVACMTHDFFRQEQARRIVAEYERGVVTEDEVVVALEGPWRV